MVKQGIEPTADPKGSLDAPSPGSSSTPVTAIAATNGGLSGRVEAIAANLNAEPQAGLEEEPTAFKRDLAPETAPTAKPSEPQVEVTVEKSTLIDGVKDSDTHGKAAAKAIDGMLSEGHQRAKSLAQGYTGNSCSECQNFTMVRNGTCEKCDTCGATSGCS